MKTKVNTNRKLVNNRKAFMKTYLAIGTLPKKVETTTTKKEER